MHAAGSLTALVARAAAGDVQAFESIVRRFQDFAVGYGYGLLGDVSAAEDAAQEAFIEAWQTLHRLREPAAFVAWFRRILFKQCDRILRRPGQRALALDSLAETGMDAPDPAERAERERLVRDAVLALPEKLRVTLVLYHFADRSVAETAEFLGVPAGTVKSRLNAARAALRQSLRVLVEEEIVANRPSRDDRFLDRVRRFLAAAAAGREEDVRQMLAAEPALLDQPGPHPYWGGEPRALTLAAEWGRLPLLRELLAAGADPNADSSAYDGWSPLFLAITKEHPAAVTLLLNAGARMDAWCAAALGDAAVLARLLESDPALVRARGPNQATPLHFARTEDVARLLVGQGADLSALDKYGATPLRCTAYSGPRCRSAARYLAGLEDAVDIHIAVAIADIPLIERLLDRDPALVHGVDPHLGPASARGSLPLHIAAALGDIDVASLLLDRGADPNAFSMDGHAPLHNAAKAGDLGMTQFLLSRGARKDLRDREHNGTPADWADFFDHPQLAAVLQP